MDSSSGLNIVLLVLIALAVAGRGFRVNEDYIVRWANSAGLDSQTRTDQSSDAISCGADGRVPRGAWPAFLFPGSTWGSRLPNRTRAAGSLF